MSANRRLHEQLMQNAQNSRYNEDLLKIIKQNTVVIKAANTNASATDLDHVAAQAKNLEQTHPDYLLGLQVGLSGRTGTRLKDRASVTDLSMFNKGFIAGQEQYQQSKQAQQLQTRLEAQTTESTPAQAKNPEEIHPDYLHGLKLGLSGRKGTTLQDRASVAHLSLFNKGFIAGRDKYEARLKLAKK